MHFYTASSKEVIHLKSQDDKLVSLINRIGNLEIPFKQDYFAALAGSIIGQQLSIQAMQTLLKRLLSVCNELSPATLQSLDADRIIRCGISRPKAAYLKGLSNSVLSGDIVFSELEKLEDHLVVAELTKLKGIGQWTAEMFLIFSLGRKDVFSHGDAGLRRAIRWLYEESVTTEQISMISEKWRPYRSVASLYLWEVINTGLVNVSPDIALMSSDT